jgi:hypothetical protein
MWDCQEEFHWHRRKEGVEAAEEQQEIGEPTLTT